MKKFILFLLTLSIVPALTAQLIVSLLGDSYSTYEGWIPEGNEAWYGENIGNDVKNVADTWWHKLISDNALELELNNSWSGSTICNTGYYGEDYTNRSFLTRSGNLGNNPDIIYIFGGTNDSWAKSPIGEFDKEDMYTVRPATKAMLKNVKSAYPNAICMVIINTELSADVVNSIIDACKYEDVPYIQLADIDKQGGHPSVKGMQSIATQVWKATAPLLYAKLQKH